MAKIYNARQLRQTKRGRPNASNTIRNQRSGNTAGALANQAQRAVAYRGARELNYSTQDNRTAIQRRIDRATGVSTATDVGNRANRMAQAVRTFASMPQPNGGTITNS